MATLAHIQTILRRLGKERESEIDEEDADKDQEMLGEPAREHETDLGEVVSREIASEPGVEKEEEADDDAVEIKKLKKKRRERVVDDGKEGKGDGDGEGDSVKPAKRPKKKRKKGGDAFDDLFAGLI